MDQVFNELSLSASLPDDHAAQAALLELKKASDKLKALELCGKHLGMFADKVKLDGTVPVIIVGDDQIED